MAGAGPNGGNTRRLPSWMLAPQADDTMNMSRDKANANDGVGSRPRATRKAKTLALRDESEMLKDERGSAAEGGRKRGKRKAGPDDAGSDGETRESVAEAKESKKGAERIRELAPRGRRRRIRKETIPVPEDNELSEISEAGADDDDFDLTVDDLMSIASEYISANGDPKERKLSRRDSAEEISTTATRKVQVNPVDAISCDPKPPSSSVCMSQSSKETVAREEIVVPTEMTGDPAQDMLNLLLGPLLKKHVDKEEKKDEFWSSRMSFTEEFSQNQTTSIVKETIPQPKKKTSLKDKIAMLPE